MKTITIDPNIYKDAEDYAKQHNISMKELVEKYFISLASLKKHDPVHEESAMDMSRYKISPTLKKMENDFVCPQYLSDDYKSEIKEMKSTKYQ